MKKQHAPPPKRPKRRDLTVEKIVEAALVVLKSSDPSALTMRNIAEQCGVSAMAIYHHVDDKEHVATLAVDSIFLSATKKTRKGKNWRDQALDLWETIRHELLETPGAGAVFVRRAVIGPGTASATQQIFSLLKQGGFSGRSIAEATDAMTMLLIGSIANELTRPANIRERLGEQVPASQTPLLHDHMNVYANRDGAERFQTGIRWLLDGAGQEEFGAVNE